MAVKAGSKYEWVRGDYQGNIDEVFDIKDGFINFKSGRRCGVDVFEEYLLPAGTQQAIKQPTTQMNQSAGKTTSKGVTMVQFEQDEDNNVIIDADTGQPVFVKPEIAPVPKTDLSNPNVQHVHTEKPVETKVNPIALLINQSSKDDCELNLSYSVKIPKKSVYGLLKDSFNNVDIDNEILDTIISEIDINELRNYFKKELLEKIKLHYKS
jgi:hypothetical protein